MRLLLFGNNHSELFISRDDNKNKKLVKGVVRSASEIPEVTVQNDGKNIHITGDQSSIDGLEDKLKEGKYPEVAKDRIDARTSGYFTRLS